MAYPTSDKYQLPGVIWKLEAVNPPVHAMAVGKAHKVMEFSVRGTGFQSARFVWKDCPHLSLHPANCWICHGMKGYYVEEPIDMADELVPAEEVEVLGDGSFVGPLEGGRPANQYNPDYASPPGDTLREIMNNPDDITTVEELADRMAVLPDVVLGLLMGDIEITPYIADQLEYIFETPASFWINRERNYRETLARLEGREDRAMFDIAQAAQFPYDKPDKVEHKSVSSIVYIPEPLPPSAVDWQHAAARGIVHSLSSRGDFFEDVEEAMRIEIVDSIRAIIQVAPEWWDSVDHS